MPRQVRLPQLSCAATVMAAAACMATLAFVATAKQPQLVAGLPWLGLPTLMLQWGLPILVALPLMWVQPRESSSVSPLMPDRRLMLAFVIGVLVLLWLVSLVRHDRPLSAWHGGWLLAVVALWPLGRRWRFGLTMSAAGLLAVVSYGAIWGETRCDEPDSTGCLVEGGLRVIVPPLLERAGVRVFADLRGADLRGVDLRARDLRYADLRGARMERARLDGSNLRRARLDGVDAPRSSWRGVFMNGASASDARLFGADMRQMQAYRVDFSRADLRAADLRDASLSHARLVGTALEGTRVEGAYLRFTIPPWPRSD